MSTVKSKIRNDSLNINPAVKELTKIYGTAPSRPDHLFVSLDYETPFISEGIILRKYELTAEYGDKQCSFPFKQLTRENTPAGPIFIFLDLNDTLPSENLPCKEILDLDATLFIICCDDVSKFSGDVRSGVGNLLSGKRRKDTSPGKLAYYAWAASRVLDFVHTLPNTINKSVCLTAHPALSEAALLAGALDERFFNTAAFDLNTKSYIQSPFAKFATAAVNFTRRVECLVTYFASRNLYFFRSECDITKSDCKSEIEYAENCIDLCTHNENDIYNKWKSLIFLINENSIFNKKAVLKPKM